MSVVSFSGSQDDVILEFGWMFRVISLCEEFIPAVATCRRSLDSQYLIEDAIQQQHHTTEDPHIDDHHTSLVRCRRVESENTKNKEASVNAQTEPWPGPDTNASSLILAACREHVGPGLKTM